MSGSSDPELSPLLTQQLVTKRVRYRKGDTIFRIGDPFTALYAIRSGSCKTMLLTIDGEDQIAGYHMSGEIVGMDGLQTRAHGCQAVALEDIELCVLPFERMSALAREDRQIQDQLFRVLSSEIGRERNMMLMLGTMHAEQRLSAFLLDLAGRYKARGYSGSEFILRMTRAEIGSLLGLKLETVSRLFSRFAHEGLIDVDGRVVKLRNVGALRHLGESRH